MPCFDFKCNSCGVIKEYNTNASLPVEFHPPKDLICPTCNTGKLEINFASSVKDISFDVVGGFSYQYGAKAWKRNMSTSDQAEVLAGTKDPY